MKVLFTCADKPLLKKVGEYTLKSHVDKLSNAKAAQIMNEKIFSQLFSSGK